MSKQTPSEGSNSCAEGSYSQAEGSYSQAEGSQLGIVLLAAGASRRFEGIKQLAYLPQESLPKQSISKKSFPKKNLVEETPSSDNLLQMALQKMAELPAVKRIVTLGANRDEILADVKLPANVSVQIVDNWQEGIAASIRSGVDALQLAKLSHVLIMLADQPALSIADYNRLIELSCNNLQNIICAHYGQKNAVPAIFPASCFPLLMALSGDKGAGKALNSKTLSQEVISVDMNAGEKDIDTRADLMRFQQE